MIQEAVNRLDAWIEREQFRGWDPYDALNSSLLKALTFGQRRMGQVWVQLMKRSPVNLRPLLRVPKEYNPKGMGLFLASYWRKYQLTGDAHCLDQAAFFAEWLRANVTVGYAGACWGYNFDWPNRGFFAPAGTPTIVNTAFVGLSFLDVARSEDHAARKRVMPHALTVAESACRFVLSDLNRLQTVPGNVCFSYTPLDKRYVHNANLLGAQLLAETAALNDEPTWQQMALAAARYTVACQRPDGSWLYGEEKKDRWVDNFHTGFVLVSLQRMGHSLQTDEFRTAVSRGYAYWKEQMFLADGTPKYYADRLYPIDIHAVAQAILTFLAFTHVDNEAYPRAVQVAEWGIQHMQDQRGYFHYQIYPAYRIRIPYMRWAQAWMQRALMALLMESSVRSQDSFDDGRRPFENLA